MAGNDVATRIRGREEVREVLANSCGQLVAVGREVLVGVHHATDIRTVADRDALTVDVIRHIAFKAIVHHPVFASIRVDPDSRSVTLAGGFTIIIQKTPEQPILG